MGYEVYTICNNEEMEFRTDMSWFIHLRHWLTDDLLPPPGRIGKNASYLGSLVAAATSHGVGNPLGSAITCNRRPGHKPCEGKIMLLLRDDGYIQWECESCDYKGLLSGWEDTMWDLRKAKRVGWYDDSLAFDVSEEEYQILSGIATSSIDTQAIIAGALTTGDEILIVAEDEIMGVLVRDLVLAFKCETNKKKKAILNGVYKKAKESREILPPLDETSIRNSPTYH